MEKETNVWSGRPSQLINFSKFLIITALCVCLFYFIPNKYFSIIIYKDFRLIHIMVLLLIVSALLILYYFFNIYTCHIEITSERLMIYSGVFTREREEIEIYRIKDYKVITPFAWRIFDISNIILYTSDRTTKNPFLPGIKKAYKVVDLIRDSVEKQRVLKGVKEFDHNVL